MRSVAYIGWVFALLSAGDSNAVAVWARRPPCEEEQAAVNDGKSDLDGCLAKFEAGRPVTGPGNETACFDELKALISAADKLKGCMEKRVWWKPKE